ncbi:hypothetical protein D0Z07_9007 [Hyphodiscus hymeniophilus]|uniref:Uncharacterized protein n=1 Tax=Hyphodiscus hymeniophilus TaxID=353542 RepID=A0A9P6VDK3_9HELO|nr:hypothetical protein D0Z07_9007 [Hyphodiscus hymeniophilus]
MPTPLDKALNSKVNPSVNKYINEIANEDPQNTFLAFTGIVTAVAAWSIWGGDMFPRENDPSGGMFLFFQFMPPFLRCLADVSKRNLHPNPKDTKEELLERVRANLRAPRS